MSNPGSAPARQCGECQVCCTVFELQETNFDKPAGTPCVHLASHGCGIHEHRPQVCRAFNCGWKQLPGLPDHLRPDLSGVLIYPVPHSMPNYLGLALIVSLSRGVAHLNDMDLMTFLLTAVTERQPVYLAVHGDRADAKGLFLNPALERPVAAQDQAGFAAVMRQAIERKMAN